MWYDGEYLSRHIRDIGVLWVRFLMMSTTVSDIWYPQFTANLDWVGVVTIEIGIYMPPVLWLSRQ